MASFGGEDKKRKLDGQSAPSALRPEEIRDLLTALKQEQVVDILVKASSAHPDVLADVRDAASKDPATRKLFVRGLAWETTTQQLRSAYEEFGEIDEGAVITDKTTGKSRGFGFITFRHIDSAQKALRNPKKEINGRFVYANLAALGSSSTRGESTDTSQRKVYVGGLSYDTTNESLLDYFGKYGEIEEGSVATDKATGKSRGFAFVTYRTVEGAQAACAEPVKLIDTRNVQVKLAVDGRQQRQQQTQEQTSASGLQSYSAGGMGNQGFGAGFGSPGMGNRPMINQPMSGGNLSAAQLSQLSNLSGYSNQGGVTGGQYGGQQMGTGQGFVNPAQQFVNPVGQQFGQQGQAAPLQQPSQQQFANQQGFGANPAGAVQQFTPQAGGQQQYGQQGFTNPGQQQFPAQMVGQVGGVQQPQAQFLQGGTPQMTGGYQQGATAGAAAGVAGGLSNTMYNPYQGQ